MPRKLPVPSIETAGAAQADADAAVTPAGRGEPPAFMFRSLPTRALARLRTAAGQAAKLVAIVAPIGYGKTVLMSMWLAEQRRAGRHCLWLSIDDRETTLDGLIDALEARLAGRAARLHPTHALFRGQTPAEARIDRLIDALAQTPAPLSLFIDNLPGGPDADLGRLIDRLCFDTGSDLQLVLSSTRELPFDLGRAQLEGRLWPIGAADLGFDAGEVAELLGPLLVAAIGAGGVAEVTARTEGWPAAVRMAQIILSHADDPQQAVREFSGSDQALAQLLNRQVLSGFSDALREFLYCLALLRTFSAELCAQAIGGADVGRHLAYLIERNVFVIPLDRSRSQYRLHGLFRDHLRHEADRLLPPKRRQTLLIRAARACERVGQWRDAVDYALASGSAAVARQILEQIAPRFVRDRGDVQQYLRWLDALHTRGRQAGPEAEYWFVWALAFHRRYDDARRHSAVLASRVQRAEERRGVADRDLRRRIAILRTSIDSLTDHLEDAQLGAGRWLAEPDAEAGDDAFNRTAAHCIVGGYHLNHLAFAEARRALAAARETAFQAASVYVDGWVSAYAALPAIHEGSLAAAQAELGPVLATLRGALGDDSGIVGTLALLAARIAVGTGNDGEARALLDIGLASARSHGFLEAAACGLEAAVLLWDGQSSLQGLREIAGAYPPRLALMLSCFVARRLIRLGRLEDAKTEAARIGLRIDAVGRRSRQRRPNGPPLTEALRAALHIELLIAADRHPQALPLIAEELQRARRHDCTARQVELLLDSAAVAVRGHQIVLAVRHVTRAITLAASRRIVRPFDDHAETLAQVVDGSRPSAWGFASDEERRFFAERCRPRSAQERDAAAGPADAQGRLPLLGTPTPRELELLRYVDAGLSNQQIADRAEVSLTTVKWHLQNLYAKLGVSSRAAALARARATSLLPR